MRDWELGIINISCILLMVFCICDSLIWPAIALGLFLMGLDLGVLVNDWLKKRED